MKHYLKLVGGPANWRCSGMRSNRCVGLYSNVMAAQHETIYSFYSSLFERTKWVARPICICFFMEREMVRVPSWRAIRHAVLYIYQLRSDCRSLLHQKLQWIRDKLNIERYVHRWEYRRPLDFLAVTERPCVWGDQKFRLYFANNKRNKTAKNWTTNYMNIFIYHVSCYNNLDWYFLSVDSFVLYLALSLGYKRSRQSVRTLPVSTTAYPGYNEVNHKFWRHKSLPKKAQRHSVWHDAS